MLWLINVANVTSEHEAIDALVILLICLGVALWFVGFVDYGYFYSKSDKTILKISKMNKLLKTASLKLELKTMSETC